MAKLTEPKKLKGFRDYPPELLSGRRRVLRVIERVAEHCGFQSISTPALEYSEVLLGQAGAETDKEVYRFEDHGGREVALRYDLTVPFARFVAEHQSEIAFPFRKLQIGNVWRGEKPQKGRYREFMQCDVDIIGVDSLEADVEILICLATILDELDFGKFRFQLSNRQLLSGLIHKCLPNVKDHAPVLIAIDKLTKIGRPAVLDLMEKIDGASPEGSERLLEVLGAKDNLGHTPLDLVEEELGEAFSEEVARFRETLQLLATQAGKNGIVQADLSIARGLGYYTGLVFETTLEALPGIGSICSGGRYNDLVSRFTKRSQPGIGGSIGLDRLVAALEELGKIEEESTYGVLVALAAQDARKVAFSLASELRRHGFCAEVGLQRKLDKQFRYADKRGFPWVLIVGTDEMDSGHFKLRNMKTGEEFSLPLHELVSKIMQARYDEGQ